MAALTGDVVTGFVSIIVLEVLDFLTTLTPLIEIYMNKPTETLVSLTRIRTLFLAYIGEDKIKQFLTLDFKFQLGWYLEFIESQGLLITISDNLITIYYIGDEQFPEFVFETDNILKRLARVKPNLLNAYSTAIQECFSWLDIPSKP
jgi:hypothetical protein